MKKIALVIFASLLIAGCGNKYTVQESQREINCEPYPYPAPLNYPSIGNEIVNKGDHWELSHKGFEIMNARNLETERWIKDMKALWDYMLDCIGAYNYKPPPDEKSWWQFWK